MKKILLSAMAIIAAVGGMNAENRIINYTDADGAHVYGSMTRVSSNGRWAVGGDSDDKSGAFIVDTNAPEALINIPGGELYDITDEGLAVGSWYFNEGTAIDPVNSCQAAYYEDGKWVLLPLPKETIGQSHARAVSADGRYIAGMVFCHATDSEVNGKYYPMLWTRSDETGKYVLTAYNNLDLPGNMGFTVFDITDDGSTMVGYVFAHAGSTVPAMLRDGKLVVWNKMEMKKWPFYYKDKVFYYDTAFIDDIEEGAEDSYWFDGALFYINGKYAFGHRSIASNVDVETGRGTVTHHRCILNLETGEFTDEPSDNFFTCGLDPDHAFMTSNLTAYYIAGSMKTLTRAFGITTDVKPHDIMGCDEHGRIFAGSHVWFNEAIQSYCTSPILMLLDEALDGVENVSVAPNVVADECVYDLWGRRFDNAASLRPGIYVKNGGKFVVK